MFEYGNLKCVENDENKNWYFIVKDEDKFIEKDLGEDFFLEILNKLGEERWELVSIDATLGFVLKRKLQEVYYAENN